MSELARIGDVSTDLAEVVELDRARAQLASSSLDQGTKLASSREPFSEVIRAIEILDDEPLVNPGRGWCEDAYAGHPAGFLIVVKQVVDRHRVRSRRALLVWKVKQNDHVLADRLAGPSTTRAGWRHGECTHDACQFQDRCIRRSS